MPPEPPGPPGDPDLRPATVGDLPRAVAQVASRQAAAAAGHDRPQLAQSFQLQATPPPAPRTPTTDGRSVTVESLLSTQSAPVQYSSGGHRAGSDLTSPDRHRASAPGARAQRRVSLTLADLKAMSPAWVVAATVADAEELLEEEEQLSSAEVCLVLASVRDISPTKQVMQALAECEGVLPPVIIVLKDSHLADEDTILEAQRQFLEWGIEDVVCGGSASDVRLAIRMGLARGHQHREDMRYSQRELQQAYEATIKERVRREVSVHFERHRDSKVGLFWQAAHRTFEGFPALDRSLPVPGPGAQCGPCMLLEAMGSGSFGTVFTATSTDHGQEAVKVVAKESLTVLDKVIRLWKEMHFLSKLDHQNIVQLYGVMQGPSHVFLRMEMAGTGTLFRALRNTGGRFSPEACLQFSVQLVSAVAHCHSQQVAHRDLKPENVVITDDARRIKVCDFGSSTTTSKPRRDLVGTMPFIAPEVLNPHPSFGYVPEYTDMWSVGVIMLEMACGLGKLNEMLNWRIRLEPKAEHALELRAYFAENPAAIAQAVNTQWEVPSSDMGATIDGALRMDPLDRWSAAYMLEQLQYPDYEGPASTAETGISDPDLEAIDHTMRSHSMT